MFDKYFSERCKAISTVIGCVLIHLILGTLYTCANINPYFISYVYNETGEYYNVATASWLFSLSYIGLTAFMPIGGLLDNWLGATWTLLLGSFCIFIAVFATYYTLKYYVAILLLWGLLFGFGCSLCYSTCINASLRWYPKKSGLISGIIVMGYGCGALLFNNVQTLLINPNNIAAVFNETIDARIYPIEVTNNVPTLVLVSSISYGILLLIGVIMIFKPQEQKKEEQTEQEVLIQEPVKGLTPIKALSTMKFWEIWCTFFIVAQVVLFISSYYKFIAMSFITDDQFMALIGSISSLFNGFSRPLWGYMSDRFGYKITMSIICSILGLFIGTVTLVPSLGQYVFLIWICLIYFAIGGIFAVFPNITSLSFGRLFFSTIYGFICTSEAVAAVIFSVSSSFLLNYLGYSGMTYLIAGLCAVNLLLVILPKKWTYNQLPSSDGIVSTSIKDPEVPVTIPSTDS
ncbi:hypothetical protein WA158_006291 [Blastocystis sp. Blastoise]